jgi:hypothetical protein
MFNVISTIKILVAVFSFLGSNKLAIEESVQNAEAAFPAAKSGIDKTAHVLGSLYTLITGSGSALAGFPIEAVTPFLTGHIASVAKALFPQPAAEAGK